MCTRWISSMRVQLIVLKAFTFYLSPHRLWAFVYMIHVAGRAVVLHMRSRISGHRTGSDVTIAAVHAGMSLKVPRAVVVVSRVTGGGGVEGVVTDPCRM